MRGTARTAFHWTALGALVLACSSTSRNQVDQVEVEAGGGAAGEAATPTSVTTVASSGGSTGGGGGSGGSGGTLAVGGASNAGADGSGGIGGVAIGGASIASTATSTTAAGADDGGSNDGSQSSATISSAAVGTSENAASTATAAAGTGGTTATGTTATTTATATTSSEGGTSSVTTGAGGTGTGGGGTTGTPPCPACSGATPVCLDGVCVPCSPNPTPTSCEDQVPQYCDDTGEWQPIESGACSNGETCAGGQCVCEFSACGSACVDTETDADHCGECNHSCQTGDCIDGTCEPLALVSGRSEPWGLAVNGDNLYWVERGENILYRMNLGDGSASPVSIVNWQCSVPSGAVIADANYVYWESYVVCRMPHSEVAEEPLGALFTGGNSYYSSIQTLTLNSTSVYAYSVYDHFIYSLDQGIYSSLSRSVRSIAANDAGLYWLELSESTNKIMRTDPTSIDTGAVDLTSTTAIPQGIATHGGRIYWTERESASDATGTVRSISTAGGTVQTIATDQNNPTTIAVDASGVYWTNRSTTEGEVMRASLLGNDAEAIAVDQIDPNALVLTPNAIYWTNTEGGEVMTLPK